MVQPNKKKNFCSHEARIAMHLLDLYCNIVGNKLIIVCCPSCNSIVTYCCLVTCQAHKSMSQGEGRTSNSIFIIQSLNYVIPVIGI